MKSRHILFGALVSTLTMGAWAEPPKMKMTTEIPEGIETPNKLETSLGTLTSFDGCRRSLRSVEI
ncbi:MAG: hypothetical protein GY937_03910 [bacterium]|nr:hypothetical protein [bacterium]